MGFPDFLSVAAFEVAKARYEKLSKTIFICPAVR